MECKNCQNILRENADYCSNCGAKVIRNRLSLKNLFYYLNETYFNIDNRLLRTMVSLIKRPADVIDGYVSGVRMKYLDPLTFFTISITISGFYMIAIQKYFPDAFNFTSFYDSEIQKKFTEQAMQYVFEYNAALTFLIIPGLAVISWIVFLNKRYNLSEHIVLYLYTMSLFSMFAVVVNLIILLTVPEIFMTASVVLYFLVFIYHIYVLKKIFALSIGQMVLKILVFLPMFLIAYIVLSMIILILVLIFGDISLRDFAPPS